MDKAKDKKRLRQEIMKQVTSLDNEYCEKADGLIVENLLSTGEYQEANCIFCYVGRSQEINTVPILEDALRKGKVVGVPRCIGKGVMEVCRIQNMADLVPGAYGIMEPDQSCQVLQPEELELVIVPCLSCTIEGVRLGYGGGYYDRYLTQVNSPKIVLCREKIICKDIPKESHDQPMNCLITENGVIYC